MIESDEHRVWAAWTKGEKDAVLSDHTTRKWRVSILHLPKGRACIVLPDRIEFYQGKNKLFTNYY